MENVVVILYLIFLIAELTVETLICRVNMKFAVQRWRAKKIPELFVGRIGQKEYEKSVQYTLAQGRFEIGSSFYNAALNLLVLFGGVLPVCNEIARHAASSLPAHTEAVGIAFCITVGLLFTVMTLPVDLYSTFVLEERFGFNKTNLKTFVLDKIKGLALGLLIGVPFLFGVLWLMQASGSL